MENESVPLTHQEICCLKTALALVVVKRRFAAKASAHEDDVNTKDASAESSAMSLCPWMDHNTNVQRDSFVPVSKVGDDDDWAHCNHMLQLAVQNAMAMAVSNRNSHFQLQSLTTHLACQIVQLSKKECAEDPQCIAQEWIRSSLTQQFATSSSDASAIVTVWQGILQAKPVEISTLLVPFLLVALRSALEPSKNDDGNSVWSKDPTNAVHVVNLLEQALHQSSEETLQMAMEALMEYSIPVSVVNLASLYQSMRRQSVSQQPGSKLLLRFGVSILMQKLLMASKYKGNHYM